MYVVLDAVAQNASQPIYLQGTLVSNSKVSYYCCTYCCTAVLTLYNYWSMTAAALWPPTLDIGGVFM